jgi:drug/metabolite transporter (DMT)-like permease
MDNGVRSNQRLLLYVVLCLIWGTTWLAIKVGLDDLPPFLSASIRFMIASTILFALIRARKSRTKEENGESRVFFFFLSFVWITIPYGLVYWGEQYVSSGLCSILFATMPFYVALMGHFWVAGESLNTWKVIGLVVGFLGLLAIFFETSGSPKIEAVYGFVALMLSPLVAAVSNVIVKQRISRLDVTSMNAQVMAYGAIFLFIFSLFLEWGQPIRFSGRAIFTLFYLGTLGSAFAFVVYTHLLKTETVLKMSLIVYITPVIALFVGWIFRGETITLKVLAGSALVFLGVHLVTRSDIRSE